MSVIRYEPVFNHTRCARVMMSRCSHDGQQSIPPSRICREYHRNWSRVLVQNTLVTELERRIQSVLDSEMSISIHYLLGFMRYWHDLPTYSGPEKETNSAHILRLFWGAVLAVACRAGIGERASTAALSPRVRPIRHDVSLRQPYASLLLVLSAPAVSSPLPASPGCSDIQLRRPVSTHAGRPRRSKPAARGQ